MKISGPIDLCPVCTGAGGWSATTGVPKIDGENGRVKCFFCKGTGKRPPQTEPGKPGQASGGAA